MAEIQLHIKNDFAVTGWMICVIPHIRKDAKYLSDSDHRKQVIMLSNEVYSVQNKSRFTAISSSYAPENNVLIALLTCFL